MSASDAIDKLIETLNEEIKVLKSRQVISEDAINHLKEIYKITWTEACYDAYNTKSYESAKRIYPHIKALEEELKFNN